MRPCQLCGRSDLAGAPEAGEAGREHRPRDDRTDDRHRREPLHEQTHLALDPRHDEHHDDELDPGRELAGSEDAEEDEPAHESDERKWLSAAHDPNCGDREAVVEVVADRDRGVQRCAASARRRRRSPRVSRCRRAGRSRANRGSRASRASSRSRAGSTGSDEPVPACARPSGTTRTARRVATTRPWRRCRCPWGLRDG